MKQTFDAQTNAPGVRSIGQDCCGILAVESEGGGAPHNRYNKIKDISRLQNGTIILNLQ